MGKKLYRMTGTSHIPSYFHIFLHIFHISIIFLHVFLDIPIYSFIYFQNITRKQEKKEKEKKEGQNSEFPTDNFPNVTS